MSPVVPLSGASTLTSVVTVPGHVPAPCSSFVLVRFYQLDILESAGKRDPQLKNCFHQIGLWAGLWGRLARYGLCPPWAGGPRLYKKRPSKPWRASERVFFMASAQVPALTSLRDGLCRGPVREINPFPAR